MTGWKFDPAKLAKLTDPARLETLRPDDMWSAAAVPNARIVVEIGAGTGMFAVEFARRMHGGVLYACDVAPEAVEWMREQLPLNLTTTPDAGAETARIEPLLSEESRVPLEDGIADLVFMINVHHELDDRGAILAEAYRLLRPGGRLLVVDWKDEPTPKGPPMAARIPAAVIAAELDAADFANVARHGVLPEHTVVTGTRPTIAR